MSASQIATRFACLASAVLAACAGDNNSAMTHSISGTVTGPVVGAVTVSLSGAAIASTATDEAGRYVFTGLANGDYTLTPSMNAYVFSPPSRLVSIGDADVVGRDFTGYASATTGLRAYWDGCTEADCGPPMGAPNYLCTDGTYGGPGPCTRDENGVCGWSLRDCQPVTLCTGCDLVGPSLVACEPPQAGDSGPSGQCVVGANESCSELVMQCFTP